jgi:deoxyadenosine/deoxycytidine kinase
MNTDNGNATEEEYLIYKDLLNNMMEELKGLPKKAPDLLIDIHVSYETMVERITKRGRPYEQITTDPSLTDYYQTLIQYYQTWYANYDKSPKMQIDGDRYDFVSNPADRAAVMEQITSKLHAVRGDMNATA